MLGRDIVLFGKVLFEIVELDISSVHAVDNFPVSAAHCRHEIDIVSVLDSPLMGHVEHKVPLGRNA